MGFSASGATAVVFVGLLVSVGTLAPVLDASYERRSEAQDRRAERLLDRRETAVETVNATYDNSTGEVTLVVANAGTTGLSVDDTDLLVDGRYVANWTASVEGDPGRTTWLSGENLTATATAPTKPERVVLVTETGIRAVATDVVEVP
ncbi:fla cluster protein FlaF [Halomarina pelagica]|uniref:fla cluster protein FlaF n=1 Tax=Halomarina pelagica TaxID=2961599 RepID=UPI0020C519E9|nr:fla cluster protein FlaF [Halomarina sp. BND7]